MLTLLTSVGQLLIVASLFVVLFSVPLTLWAVVRFLRDVRRIADASCKPQSVHVLSVMRSEDRKAALDDPQVSRVILSAFGR